MNPIQCIKTINIAQIPTYSAGNNSFTASQPMSQPYSTTPNMTGSTGNMGVGMGQYPMMYPTNTNYVDPRMQNPYSMQMGYQNPGIGINAGTNNNLYGL